VRRTGLDAGMDQTLGEIADRHAPRPRSRQQCRKGIVMETQGESPRAPSTFRPTIGRL
jgi:hypothetical protein